MKNRIRTLSKRLVVFTLGLCLSIGIFANCNMTSVYAAPVAHGIDVSKWQGNIDWANVAQNNVSFAFIRVGTLKKGIDPTFYYNMLAAQMYGIKTGVYIYSYATSVEEAALEAQFVLAAVKDLKVSYPIVWDIEDDVQAGLSKETLSLMANTFCAIIEAEGYYPMVYSNKYWFTSKIGPVFYDKWVAQWGAKCDIPEASVWQYTDSGKINGIAGSVDLNYALKDYSTQIVDTGWVARKNFLYFYKDYKMQRGWLDLGLAKYYLDPYGRMVTGWLPLEDGIYYLKPDGVMAVGFTPIGTGMYFFDATGKMLTGLQNLGGLTFLFSEQGAMYTGFIDFPEGKRYFAPDGHMAVGFEVIQNKLYFFNESGYMQTGFIQLNGLSYLFNPDGTMYTGWYTDGINTKYFETDGHMVTGLAQIGNDLYLFDENGNMQTGFIDLGGNVFLFGEDGKMIQYVIE